MPRKKEDSFISQDGKMVPISFDHQSLVVQANDIIFGRQENEALEGKILRLCIAQTMQGDDFFRPYTIKVSELANLLDVSVQYLYRELPNVCQNIFEKPLTVKRGKDWTKYSWVSYCTYTEENRSVQIKLNDDLKPLLLNLKNTGIYSTQYLLSSILKFKTANSIRIYEMLEAKIKGARLGSEISVQAELSVDEIRVACNCIDKYPSTGDLYTRVIKKSIEEINNLSIYNITVQPIKNPENRKKIIGYTFFVSSKYA